MTTADRKKQIDLSQVPYELVPISELAVEPGVQLIPDGTVKLHDATDDGSILNSSGAWTIPSGEVVFSKDELQYKQLEIYKSDIIGNVFLASIFVFATEHCKWFRVNLLSTSDDGESNDADFFESKPVEEVSDQQTETLAPKNWLPKTIQLADEFWKITYFSGVVVAVHEANFTEIHVRRNDFPDEQPSVFRTNVTRSGYKPGVEVIATMLGKTTEQMGWVGVMDSYDETVCPFLNQPLLDYFIENKEKYWRGKTKLAGRFLFRLYFNMRYAHLRHWWPNGSIQKQADIARDDAREFVRDVCGFTRFWKVPNSWCFAEVESEF